MKNKNEIIGNGITTAIIAAVIVAISLIIIRTTDSGDKNITKVQATVCLIGDKDMVVEYEFEDKSQRYAIIPYKVDPTTKIVYRIGYIMKLPVDINTGDYSDKYIDYIELIKT